MKTIRMYNGEIETFSEFLIGLKLKGRESRMRTRFIKLLQERLQQVGEEHKELLKQHSHLDSDGEPKIREEDGKQMYDVKDMEAFSKDYNDLMSEEFIIEVVPSNEKMIEAVEDVVLDCDLEFSGQDALRFDRFCEIVEGIDDESQSE